MGQVLPVPDYCRNGSFSESCHSSAVSVWNAHPYTASEKEHDAMTENASILLSDRKGISAACSKRNHPIAIVGIQGLQRHVLGLIWMTRVSYEAYRVI